MRRHIWKLGLIGLFLAPCALAQGWNHTLGGSATDSLAAIARDSNGNLFVAGLTSSFGAGGEDALLLKYDSSGNLVWAKTWGGPSDDYATAVATDSVGNVYVTGGTESFGAGWFDVFLLKFDNNGNLLWSKTWGGSSYDVGHDLAFDASGNVLVAAETYSYNPPHKGFSSAAVLKFTPDGSLLWSQVWASGVPIVSGPVYDGGYSLDVDGNGNILLSGITWDYNVSPNHNSIFVVKFDSSGNFLWNRNWSGPSEDEAWGTKTVRADATGNTYVAGRTANQCTSTNFGTCDFAVLLLKLNPNGNFVWSKTWNPDTGYDTAISLDFDPSGNIVLTGAKDEFGSTATAILLQFDPSGDLLSSLAWSGGSGAVGSAVLLDSTDDVFVAGNAPNNIGSWQVASVPTGAENGSLTTQVNSATAAPVVTLGSPSGTLTSPTGVTDTGAGGQDAFVSMIPAKSFGDSVTLLPACVNGLQVDVNGAASSGAFVTILSWVWGDGTTTTGFFPQSHTYSSQGQYNIQVTAHYSNGSSASSSQIVSVGPALLSNCLAVSILAGQYGSVSYQASVGAGVISPGSSVTLQLALADDVAITANSSVGYIFDVWVASPGITGTDGNPINANSPSTIIVANGSGTIGAIFTINPQSYLPVPTTVTLSASPVSLVELPSSSAALTATVLDQGGNPMPGVQVTFATSAGVLSATSDLTKSNGQASVTLSPNLNSIAPLVAVVTGAAGTVQGSTSVTFSPSGSTVTNWSGSSAFNVHQTTVNLNQFLSTPVNFYDDCIRFFLCAGTPVNLSQLTSPATVYFVTAAGSPTQFTTALSQFLGIGQCTQSSHLNCVPSGYNPEAVIILELPVIQASEALFDAGFSSPLSLCAPAVSAVFLSNSCVTTTSSGYVNVALTVSANSNTPQETQDLLNLISNAATLFYKSSPSAALSTLEAELQAILDLGDITTTIITSDLDQTGSLNSYTVLDLYFLKSAIGNGFQIDGITGKFLTMLDAGTKVGVSAAADIPADAQLIMTSLDLSIELLPDLIPSLNTNQLFQWFQTGLNVATTIVDPPGATILPSFYDVSGSLVLGYNPISGEIVYASPAGILFPIGNSYLTLLSESPAAPSNYLENLSTVGTPDAAMPYSAQIRSYNHTQAVQSYSGMLASGNSVTIPIEFNSGTGALIPQLTVIPVVTTVQKGTSISVTAKAVLSDGSPATASGAFLILNGELYTMQKRQTDTYAVKLNFYLPTPTTGAVYMLSPGTPGGFATVSLAASQGHPFVIFGGSVQQPLVKDGSGNFVAAVKVTNQGDVTIDSALIGTDTTLGRSPLASASAPITNLAPGASETVTLKFPITVSLSHATNAPLNISGTYAAGTLSGNWSLTFRSVNLAE